MTTLLLILSFSVLYALGAVLAYGLAWTTVDKDTSGDLTFSWFNVVAWPVFALWFLHDTLAIRDQRKG